MTDTELLNPAISHLQVIETWKSLIKGMHWAAKTYSMHKVLDDLYSDLSEYSDTLAEAVQGVYCMQFAPTVLVTATALIPEQLTELQAIYKIRDCVDEYEKTVVEVPGLQNIVNDFQSKLLKHSYLLLLASR
jgi:DNA-binding ferritin-like protein